MFTRLILTLALLGYAGAQPPGPSGKRRALVIGNDDYRSLPAVPAAAQDAELMSQALKGAGFEVDSVRNLTVSDSFTKSDFLTKENEFLKRVSAGDICFVYYSGYAVQGDQEDDNYLLPVNF